MSKNPDIRKPEGKLGVMTVGLGAVATTFVAGVMSVRKGLSKPIGSLTQMGTIRLGKRTEKRSPLIKDFIAWPGSTTSSSAAGTSSRTTPTRPP